MQFSLHESRKNMKINIVNKTHRLSLEWQNFLLTSRYTLKMDLQEDTKLVGFADDIASMITTITQEQVKHMFALVSRRV